LANQLSSELNQRCDAKFLLIGDQRQRSGGGLERWDGRLHTRNLQDRHFA